MSSNQISEFPNFRIFKFAILIFIFTNSIAFAGDVDKAFKYLNTGDYPNAKKYLVEALTDEPENAAVNYGLAKYFSSKDNPSM